jgi:predicted MPP superfamily phosphohydrolase
LHLRVVVIADIHGRDLVVSAGLGVSGLPIRFGRPPEIVVIELGGAGAGSA